MLRERFLHGEEREVESKSTPTDLVSEADRASQRHIREEIALRRPRDGFLGEEDEDEESGTSGLCWVVDPLDGTVNFLFGLPQWCVSVAVRDERGHARGCDLRPDARGGSSSRATRGGEARIGVPSETSDEPASTGELGAASTRS